MSRALKSKTSGTLEDRLGTLEDKMDNLISANKKALESFAKHSQRTDERLGSVEKKIDSILEILKAEREEG